MLEKNIKCMVQSNRWKYLLLSIGIVIGTVADDAYCAFLACTCTAGATGVKQEWGGKPDWIDFGITLSGVVVGHLIRILLWRM